MARPRGSPGRLAVLVALVARHDDDGADAFAARRRPRARATVPITLVAYVSRGSRRTGARATAPPCAARPPAARRRIAARTAWSRARRRAGRAAIAHARRRASGGAVGTSSEKPVTFAPSAPQPQRAPAALEAGVPGDEHAPRLSVRERPAGDDSRKWYHRRYHILTAVHHTQHDAHYSAAALAKAIRSGGDCHSVDARCVGRAAARRNGRDGEGGQNGSPADDRDDHVAGWGPVDR